MNTHVTPIVLDRVENAEDCKTFLVGVLTTPGFLDQAMKLIDPKGGFFSDAMTERTLEEFVKVQQGPIIETLSCACWRAARTAARRRARPCPRR